MPTRIKPVALLILALTWLALRPASSHAQPTEPAPPSDCYLFADDQWIQGQTGLVRHVRPATTLPDPVLVADKPWEGRRVCLYGTVLPKDGSGYQMWYMSRSEIDDQNPAYKQGVLAYATSADGVHWEKPLLDLHPFQGKPSNILRTTVHCPTVIDDAADPDPNRRFKLLGGQGVHNGFFGATSPDGLHWTDLNPKQLIAGSEIVAAVRDPVSKKYFAYHRPLFNPKLKEGEDIRRKVALSTSSDFQKWTPSEVILVPDAADNTWRTRPQQATEFYTMCGFPYGKQWLGFVTVFRITNILTKTSKEQAKWDGPIDVQLVTSSDGYHWQRCSDRTPIIPRGESGTFDGGLILGTASQLTPSPNGSERWLYYTGMNTTHGGTLAAKRLSLGRAAWPSDRFAYLRTQGSGGLVTKTIHGEGKSLFLNMDAQKAGSSKGDNGPKGDKVPHPAGVVRVALRDENGAAIPGYSLDDSTLLTGDSAHQPVTWANHSRLPNRPIQIEIFAEDADLYGFRLEESPAAGPQPESPK